MRSGPKNQRLHVTITGHVVPVPPGVDPGVDAVLAIEVEHLDQGGKKVETVPEVVLVDRAGRGPAVHAYLHRFVTVSGYLRDLESGLMVLQVVRIDV